MCKSIIKIISKICLWHLLTLISCHFVMLISETQFLWIAVPSQFCQLPVTISGKKKGRKLVSESIYIVVCYFFLIIFSTIELIHSRHALRVASCARYKCVPCLCCRQFIQQVSCYPCHQFHLYLFMSMHFFWLLTELDKKITWIPNIASKMDVSVMDPGSRSFQPVLFRPVFGVEYLGLGRWVILAQFQYGRV